MLKQWFPWKFLIRRTARAYGFIDPIQLLAHLRRFAQPSEVQEPIELLRAGIIFHARGLINTKTIQNNLDWVWPYWAQKQFNPADHSFIPRGFSFSHVNLTHRNWTAVGQPDLPIYPIVDPRGLVTPLYDGWSIDFWLLPENEAPLVPCRLSQVDQFLDMRGDPAVETHSFQGQNSLKVRTSVQFHSNRPFLDIEVDAAAENGGRVAVVLRPYNPEGVQFIESIDFEEKAKWRVNKETRVHFRPVPGDIFFSTYETGDVLHAMDASPPESAVSCDAGMATAAAVFPLKKSAAARIAVQVPLDEELQKEKTPASAVQRPWNAVLAEAAQLSVPDARIQYLYDAALRTMILLSAADTVPGPYTYRRFWFRDACFMLNALLAVGLRERCQRILNTFPERQKRSGYFHSQEGEWDSNGQVLWILNRFHELTHRPLPPQWRKAVQKGADWIVRKRQSGKGKDPYTGLFPAGFSAEHLGPSDYYYWDNYWGIAGLQAAAQLCGRYGDAGKQSALLKAADDFQKTVDDSIHAIPHRRSRGGIPAAPTRRMDSGAVGSMVADYPLQLTDPGDPKIMKTAGYLLDQCFHDGAFFQDMIHSGINCYLTLGLAQTLLRAGNSHFQKLVSRVAALASPTGQWPEAIHPFTGGGCMGDGQHGWAAAEWILMIRSLFVREEDKTLILGSGIFPEWLEKETPIRFGPTLTADGPLSIEIRRQNREVALTLDAETNAISHGAEIRVPGCRPQAASHYNQTYLLEVVDT